MTIPRFALRAGAVPVTTLFVLTCFGSVLAGQSPEVPPNVANQPLTTEQLSVYRSVLVSWYEGEKAKVNLGLLTDPIAVFDDSTAKPGERIGLAQPSATGESGCSRNPEFTCALSAVWGVLVTVAGTSVFRNSSAVPS